MRVEIISALMFLLQLQAVLFLSEKKTVVQAGFGGPRIREIRKYFDKI